MSKDLKDFTFEKVHSALESGTPNLLRRWLFAARHQLIDQLESNPSAVDRMFVVIPTLIARGAIVYNDRDLFGDAIATLHSVYATLSTTPATSPHVDEAKRISKAALVRLHEIGGTLVEFRRFRWFEEMDIATPSSKSWIVLNTVEDTVKAVRDFQLLWLLSSPTVKGSPIDNLAAVSAETSFAQYYTATEVFSALGLSRAKLLERVQYLQDSSSGAFLDEFDPKKLAHWS